MTDTQLIRASLQGDDNAFRTLILKYESLVASTVISMIGPGQEAEDVGQETMIRFYQNLGKFRGEASVGTYLTRISINLSLNALEKRKRHRLRFWYSAQNSDQEIPSSSTSDFDDTKEIVHQALEYLPAVFRSVIILRFINNQSIREISEILRIPQGTVLSRLARAQKKLKIILKPYLGEFYEKKDTHPAFKIAGCAAGREGTFGTRKSPEI